MHNTNGRCMPKKVTCSYFWLNEQTKHFFPIWTTVSAQSQEFHVRHEKHVLRSRAWQLYNSCNDRGKEESHIFRLSDFIGEVWLILLQLSSSIQIRLEQAWTVLCITEGWYFKGLVSAMRLCKKTKALPPSAPVIGRRGVANSRWWGKKKKPQEVCW